MTNSLPIVFQLFGTVIFCCCKLDALRSWRTSGCVLTRPVTKKLSRLKWNEKWLTIGKFFSGRFGSLLVTCQSLAGSRNSDSESGKSLEWRTWRLQVPVSSALRSIWTHSMFVSGSFEFFKSNRHSDNALLRWSAICVAIDFGRCWVTYWIDGRQVADEPLVKWNERD